MTLRIQNIVITILVIVVSASSLVYAKSSKPQTKIRYGEMEYAADFSDDKVLVGAAHNIFIGKVIKQIGTKEQEIGPETQYEVEVVDNIKGELKGTVTVDQEGGYKNGVLYLPESSKDDKITLLQEGNTYLFTTRYNKKDDWYTLISFPNANKVISTDSQEDVKILNSIVDKDSRVKQLEDAYRNEIPFEADVKNNNVLNSYKTSKQLQDN